MDPSQRLHELVLRSFRERRALLKLVLAAYRVELTGLLNRAAKTGFEERDCEVVMDLAEQIAGAARAAELGNVRADAMSLRAYAKTAAETRGEQEEGKVLLAGLKLIERILEAAKPIEGAGQEAPRGPLN